MLLSDKVGSDLGGGSSLRERNPKAECLRSELAGQLNGQ